MGIIGFIMGTLIFLLSISISLAILVPFAGIIVRYRINYNPKALNLGSADDAIGVKPDGGEDGRVVGPKITSLFGMLIRVWRIEGWKGLYKGFMPSLLHSIVNVLFLFIYIGARMKAHNGSYSVPHASMIEKFVSTIVMTVIAIPFGIITNRAITTPHRLPAFSPRLSLRLLLTSYERRRPWVLYFTPGLLMAQALHIIFMTMVFPLVRLILVPALAHGFAAAVKNGTADDISVVRLTIFLIFQALAGAVFLTPLGVMAGRLTVQRNFTPGAEFSEEDAELAAAQEGEAGVEYMGQSEDVLNLRSNSGEEPYKSLHHCMQRIVEEEGAGALFRAWWLTMLGAVAAGIA